ncbi:MAG TPA: Flp family type IVb pilin [Azospira sp.]|nr:Flp family type IVb pilin [Azospira sp.]
MLRIVENFIQDEAGVTSIEYAVLASCIAVAVVVTVFQVGQRLDGLYEKVRACIAAPSSAKCSGS